MKKKKFPNSDSQILFGKVREYDWCVPSLLEVHICLTTQIIFESLMSKFLLWANKIDCECYAITFGNGNAFQITSTELLCY